MLGVVDTTCKVRWRADWHECVSILFWLQDSFDLFHGLFKYNPSSMEQLRRLEANLNEVKRLLLAAGSASSPKGVAARNEIEDVREREREYIFSPVVARVPKSKTIVVFGKVKELQVRLFPAGSLCK